MKKRHLVVILAMLASRAYAKPMTESVASWEGQFKISSSAQRIIIEGLAPIDMWKYVLEAGSLGTAIGFSSESGDMILAPSPNNHGVQPIYQAHAVLLEIDKTARIVVLYDVQGNGEGKLVESYRYDGKSIFRESTTLCTGKPEFKWSSQDNQQSIPAKRSGER